MSLLANNVPVTKTGGASPTLQNSDLTDLLGVSVTSAVGIIAPTFTGNLSGLVSTAAQPNITSLGTLTNPVFTGTLTGASLNLDSGSLYYASGRVGIGTASPYSTLTVHAGSGANVNFILGNTYPVGSGGIEIFSTTDNYGTFAKMGIDATTLVINASAGTGNVGIGTASPADPLTVNGNIRIQNGNYLYIFNSGNTGYVPLYAVNGSGSANNADLSIPTVGDVYTNAWADYLITGHYTGFSGTPTGYIYTKKVGKTVFVNFYAMGTSNANQITLTLPYTTASAPASYVFTFIATTGGTSSAGEGLLGANAASVSFYSSCNSGNFTNGTSSIQGQFWYQSA